jgi:hypothetical protein
MYTLADLADYKGMSRYFEDGWKNHTQNYGGHLWSVPGNSLVVENGLYCSGR